LGGSGVVKAIIPSGGRGKAGGVKVCKTQEQVREAASVLLGNELLGHCVKTVLVEELIPIKQEIYTSVLTNTSLDQIELILSLVGGIEIENTAQKDQGSVLHLAVQPGELIPVHRLVLWLRNHGVELDELNLLADTLAKLHRAAADLDANLLEINPLAVTHDGRLVLLDCKLEVDDNGLSRHPDLNKLYLASLSPRERRAKELGVSYVPLDGDIGVITSGAGLGMATLDLLQQRGLAPANFLDTGGGISEALVKGVLELIMEPPQVRGAVINLYGGINRMLEAAKGILAALTTMEGNRPVVVKVIGNQQEEAWELLEGQPNVYVVRVVQTEDAVDRLVELLN
jgi:succinyl-CoA synthetase beta subunit